MEPITQLHRLVDRLATWPGLRTWHERGVARRFERNASQNMFHGVFDSYEAAAASAPTARPLGYDNDASAAIYRRMLYIDAHDYPAMFWLQRSLDEGLRTVFDLGGSVGIKFYAFAKHIGYPAGLRWTVCDVPAAAQQGREFAAERGVADRLHFTDAAADMDGSEVLYASGTLQYLPQTLGQILGGLARKPRRLVINTTAIHQSRAYFTLNSIGTAFCPYRVQAMETFCSEVEAQGYRRRDQWQNLGKPLTLPLNPELSLANYSGFCFDLTGG